MARSGGGVDSGLLEFDHSPPDTRNVCVTAAAAAQRQLDGTRTRLIIAALPLAVAPTVAVRAG